MFDHSTKENGFTLIEVLVAMVIVTILSYIAVPKFSEMSDSFDRMNARSNLLQDLKRAQAESLTKGCRGIFAISPNGTGYSFGCDFLPYDTTESPTADQISFNRSLPTGMNIQADAEIIFDSRGHSVDVDYIISNVEISLRQTKKGTTSTFMTGTLLGTGLFSLG